MDSLLADTNRRSVLLPSEPCSSKIRHHPAQSRFFDRPRDRPQSEPIEPLSTPNISRHWPPLRIPRTIREPCCVPKWCGTQRSNSEMAERPVRHRCHRWQCRGMLVENRIGSRDSRHRQTARQAPDWHWRWKRDEPICDPINRQEVRSDKRVGIHRKARRSNRRTCPIASRTASVVNRHDPAMTTDIPSDSSCSRSISQAASCAVSRPHLPWWEKLIRQQLRRQQTIGINIGRELAEPTGCSCAIAHSEATSPPNVGMTCLI